MLTTDHEIPDLDAFHGEYPEAETAFSRQGKVPALLERVRQVYYN
jgi:hypothetical protein